MPTIRVVEVTIRRVESIDKRSHRGSTKMITQTFREAQIASFKLKRSPSLPNIQSSTQRCRSRATEHIDTDNHPHGLAVSQIQGEIHMVKLETIKAYTDINLQRIY